MCQKKQLKKEKIKKWFLVTSIFLFYFLPVLLFSLIQLKFENYVIQGFEILILQYFSYPSFYMMEIIFKYIICLVFLIMVLVNFVLLISYNLYYLKTSTNTVAIYGIFEIFIACGGLITSFVFVNVNDQIPNFFIIFFKSFLSVFTVIYVCVRGLENINKKFTDKEFIFLPNFKLGSDQEGNLIFSDNLIFLARKIEQQVKLVDESQNIEKN